MAAQQIAPSTLNASIRQGLVQFFQSSQVNVLGSTTAKDLSAWVSLTATMVPPTPLPYAADTAFGTVTASNAGIVTLEVGPTDLNTVSPGTALLVISGKPTSGDAAQVICTGTLTIAAS